MCRWPCERGLVDRASKTDSVYGCARPNPKEESPPSRIIFVLMHHLGRKRPSNCPLLLSRPSTTVPLSLTHSFTLSLVSFSSDQWHRFSFHARLLHKAAQLSLSPLIFFVPFLHPLRFSRRILRYQEHVSTISWPSDFVALSDSPLSFSSSRSL